jgi:uncharacterized protein YbjT (DUF2867 family)
MTNTTHKELLIFGATGGTGQALVHAALERDYNVTAFVRDSDRAKQLFKNSPASLNFVSGDAMNAAHVAKAFERNVDAVISSLGIYHAKPANDELTHATENILTAMSAANTNRFICISSLGVGESRGQGSLMVKLIQKLSLRHTLVDKEKQEALIKSCGLAWTLIRPSRLMNGNGPANYCTWIGPAPDKKLTWSINRSDLANLTLDSLENDTSVEQAINTTGCS